jgi:hypothetical protein
VLLIRRLVPATDPVHIATFCLMTLCPFGSWSVSLQPRSHVASPICANRVIWFLKPYYVVLLSTQWHK